MIGDWRAKAVWLYGDASWKAVAKTLLTDGTAAMFWYRLMQASRYWRIWPLEMIFNKINGMFCGCIIGRGAEFGPRFVLIHSNGVVINGGVVGGADVKIEHQVTIGAEGRRTPTLGDDVFIGAGAKIIGAAIIGSRVRIGANAVVISDLPSDSTAVGVLARVILRGSRTEDDSDLPALANP